MLIHGGSRIFTAQDNVDDAQGEFQVAEVEDSEEDQDYEEGGYHEGEGEYDENYEDYEEEDYEEEDYEEEGEEENYVEEEEEEDYRVSALDRLRSQRNVGAVELADQKRTDTGSLFGPFCTGAASRPRAPISGGDDACCKRGGGESWQNIFEESDAEPSDDGKKEWYILNENNEADGPYEGYVLLYWLVTGAAAPLDLCAKQEGLDSTGDAVHHIREEGEDGSVV